MGIREGGERMVYGFGFGEFCFGYSVVGLGLGLGLGQLGIYRMETGLVFGKLKPACAWAVRGTPLPFSLLCLSPVPSPQSPP